MIQILLLFQKCTIYHFTISFRVCKDYSKIQFILFLCGKTSENLNTRLFVRKQGFFLAYKLIFQQLARMHKWEIVLLYYTNKIKFTKK